MEPNEEGKGYEFENAIVGGVIPKEYIPSIDKGIQEALESGVIAGYPVVDIKVKQAHRRLLPRGRLLRGRLQDRRLHGDQGRPEEV